MDTIYNLNNKLERKMNEIKELAKKHEQLFEEIDATIKDKDKYVLPLKKTIQNLIEYGISKEEILAITSISSDQYEEIVTEKRYYRLPYAYLSEKEAAEFDRLLEDIHNAKDIQEFIDPAKEGERIWFIHRVLKRYEKEYGTLKLHPSKGDYAAVIDQFLDKTLIDQQAKNAYLSIIRIFGNEIKRKREEVLIKTPHDKGY